MTNRHAALFLSALLTGVAHAQATMPMPAAAKGATTAAAAAELTEGEVRKVDLENRKITLKHGAIRNLDMPPMTMVFQVKDATLLDKLKAGDKVRFAATNDGGKMTVTEIQGAK